MIFSLNEIEAMGKRAARGVGLDWGLAEEAGKAARWLSAYQLPGAETLCELLTRNDGKTYDELVPISTENTWTASSGALCPLICGSALSDRAHLIAAGQEIKLAKTAKPLLLLPYLARAAEQAKTAIEVTWQGAEITITPQGVAITGDNIGATLVDEVKCHAIETTKEMSSEGVVGCEVDAEIWDRLAAFMTRYLAPDTEASRIAGAGSSLSDND